MSVMMMTMVIDENDYDYTIKHAKSAKIVMFDSGGDHDETLTDKQT